MVVTVVGLGFVGLTAALGFAVKGHEVYGIEKDDLRREQIAGGHIPFYEPGMQEQLERQLNRRLFIRADQRGCAEKSDCVLYCVGTPVGEDGGADLAYLFAGLKETLSLLPSGKSCFFRRQSLSGESTGSGYQIDSSAGNDARPCPSFCLRGGICTRPGCGTGEQS